MFQRVLLTYELGLELGPAMALIRRLSGPAARIEALARLPVYSHLWIGAEARWRDLERRLTADSAAIARVQAELAAEGIALGAGIAPELDRAVLVEAARRGGAELLVFGPFEQVSPAGLAAWAEELRRAAGVAVALSGADQRDPRAPLPDRPIRHLLCPFEGDLRALAPLGALLQGRAGPEHHLTLLSLRRDTPPAAAELSLPALAEVLGVRARIDLHRIDVGWRDAADRILDAAVELGADALVLAGDGGGLVERLAGASARRAPAQPAPPVLLAPPLPAALADRAGRLDAPDALALGGPIVLPVDALGVLGQREPVTLPLAIVAAGEIIAVASPSEGRLRIDPAALGDAPPAALGLGRVEPGTAPSPPAALIEASIALVRPGEERVALVDARMDVEPLAELLRELAGEGRAVWAARVAEDDGFAAARARLAAAGLARPRVLDIRAILDEGDTGDVPPDVDGVRLCRAAARLRAAGVRVDAAAVIRPGRAAPSGFAAIAAGALAGARARIDRAFAEPPRPGLRPRDARLEAATGAAVIAGNRVRVELDNEAARRTLLDLIAAARRRLHLQSYIVEEDEITAAVEAALIAAAERGVAVRVLADSLYSLHRSFGAENEVLSRLAACPGIEVRVSRPIDGLPSIEDLKQRDHRKLVVADGASAIVGGRNLGRAYYTGFAEVRLTPRSRWSDVPWLDAGALVDGPAAAALDAAFLSAWLEAGGDPFEPLPAPPAGEVGVRVVVHRGLADANTLEAYLALIDHAAAELVVVNGFPLQLEIQRALLRALSRGVRVRVLLGRVRPVHSEQVAFAGGAYRELADELVRARVDPLIEAGAEVHELCLRPLPGWDPALGLVRPSVHAKLVIADGGICAIGSANLDVTAGYWESELLLVIEDAALCGALAAEVERLFSSSVMIRGDAPSFRDGAGFRAWLGRHWPSLVG